MKIFRVDEVVSHHNPQVKPSNSSRGKKNAYGIGELMTLQFLEIQININTVVHLKVLYEVLLPCTCAVVPVQNARLSLGAN